MPLGTAPRRVSPGVWKTASGRMLPADSAAYWEHHYRQGTTDGQGHITIPQIPTRAAASQGQQQAVATRQTVQNLGRTIATSFPVPSRTDVALDQAVRSHQASPDSPRAQAAQLRVSAYRTAHPSAGLGAIG